MSSHMEQAKGTEGRGASSQFIRPVLQRPPHPQLYSLELAPLLLRPLAPLPDLSPGNLVSDNKTVSEPSTRWAVQNRPVLYTCSAGGTKGVQGTFSIVPFARSLGIL